MLRGRFDKELKKEAADFTSSLAVDMNFAQEDVEGSIAHARMLAKQGLLTKKEAEEIIVALEEAKELLKKNELPLDPAHEDIHPNIEKFVTSKTKAGEKLHTGRSRNDQIATDLRLSIRKNLDETGDKIIQLAKILLAQAEKHTHTVMPSYTHTQHAQATTWAHYLLAYTDQLLRDKERIAQAKARVNKSPLGSCAIAGSTLPLDRDYTAKLLGFDGLIENSLDATGSRDFLLDTLSALSILMVDLSRISQDLILFSTYEYGMVSLPEEYSSTSSAMPQKKNPDTLELIRGKTSTVIGNLTQVLYCLKGLPSGYNRDLQEAHTQIFNSFQIAKDSFSILAGIFSGLEVNKKRMEALADSNYACAIDLTELLVKKGMPFRQAHQAVGKLVKECIAEGIKLSALTPEKIAQKTGIEVSAQELKKATTPALAILERKTKGSCRPSETERMIRDRKKQMASIL